MINRQNRLKEVYEYVRKYCGIHTQADFANALNKSRNAITLALNGNEKYLTDKLFKKICETFPDVFNLDYLLTGEGTLLSQSTESDNADYVAESSPAPFVPSWADAFFDIMTQQIKQNEVLNRELRQSLEEIKELKTELSDIIKNLKK